MRCMHAYAVSVSVVRLAAPPSPRQFPPPSQDTRPSLPPARAARARILSWPKPWSTPGVWRYPAPLTLLTHGATRAQTSKSLRQL